MISIFLNRLRANEAPTVYGVGTQFGDFTHVDEVVQARLRAATLGDPGSGYNVGPGTRATIGELAETMIQVTGHDLPIEHEATRPGEFDGVWRISSAPATSSASRPGSASGAD